MHKQQKERIHACFTELALTTASKAFQTATEQAYQESVSYEDYLLSILDAECLVRRNRRVERRIKESRLSLEKTFETFDLQRLPAKIRQQVQTLRKGAFVQHNENVLLFGNPGSGKTHLASAIAHELIRNDMRVYSNTCALLLQELLYAKRELRLPKLLKRLSRFDVILIDDIGYVQQAKEEMEVLFTLLAERYERGSVIITANLPFSKWSQIFKDPMMTAAAIDRIVHHSVILELNVESYRITNAKKRKPTEGG